MNRKTQGFLALGLTLVGLLCIFLCLISSFRRQEGARTNVVDTTRLDTCQFGAPKPEDGDVLTCQFGTLPTGYLAPTVQNGVPNPPVFKYTQSDDGTLELHQFLTKDSLPNEKSKERNCTGLTHSIRGYPQPANGDFYCVEGTVPTGVAPDWTKPVPYFSYFFRDGKGSLAQYTSNAAMKSHGIDDPTVLKAKDCRDYTLSGSRYVTGISNNQVITCATNSPDGNTSTWWSFESPNIIHKIKLQPGAAGRQSDGHTKNTNDSNKSAINVLDCRGFKTGDGVWAADGQRFNCEGGEISDGTRNVVYQYRVENPKDKNQRGNYFVSLGDRADNYDRIQCDPAQNGTIPGDKIVINR